MDNKNPTREISLDDLRLTNAADEIDYEDKRVLVDRKKPSKQTFFRVHESEDFRVDTRLLFFEPEREWYFVAQNLWRHLNEELSTIKLVTCVDLNGEVFLWPIKIPASDRQNKWTSSALAAVDHAVEEWVRLIPDMARGRYRVQRALSELADPKWPEESFIDLINEAFGEYKINDLDHPVIKQLRGKQ